MDLGSVLSNHANDLLLEILRNLVPTDVLAFSSTCRTARWRLTDDRVWEKIWERSPHPRLLRLRRPPARFEDLQCHSGLHPGNGALKHFAEAPRRLMLRVLERAMEERSAATRGSPSYAPSQQDCQDQHLPVYKVYFACEGFRRRRLQQAIDDVTGSRRTDLKMFGHCVLQLVCLATAHDLETILRRSVQEEDKRPLESLEAPCALPLATVAVLHAIIITAQLPRPAAAGQSFRSSPADQENVLRWVTGVSRRFELPSSWGEEDLPPSPFQRRAASGGAAGRAAGAELPALSAGSRSLVAALEMLSARLAGSMDRDIYARQQWPFEHDVRPAGEKQPKDCDIRVERWLFGPLGPMYRGRDVPHVMSLPSRILLNAAMSAATCEAERVAALPREIAASRFWAQDADYRRVMDVLNFIHDGHRMVLPMGTECPTIKLV